MQVDDLRYGAAEKNLIKWFKSEARQDKISNLGLDKIKEIKNVCKSWRNNQSLTKNQKNATTKNYEFSLFQLSIRIFKSLFLILCLKACRGQKFLVYIDLSSIALFKNFLFHIALNCCAIVLLQYEKMILGIIVSIHCFWYKSCFSVFT